MRLNAIMAVTAVACVGAVVGGSTLGSLGRARHRIHSSIPHTERLVRSELGDSEDLAETSQAEAGVLPSLRRLEDVVLVGGPPSFTPETPRQLLDDAFAGLARPYLGVSSINVPPPRSATAEPPPPPPLENTGPLATSTFLPVPQETNPVVPPPEPTPPTPEPPTPEPPTPPVVVVVLTPEPPAPPELPAPPAPQPAVVRAAEAVPPIPVPEPATWAMMILGLGLVGQFLRHGRRDSRGVRRIEYGHAG